MHVICDRCMIGYDDAVRWTICPHSPLGSPVGDLCPKCDTLKTIHGPCVHQGAVHYGPVGDKQQTACGLLAFGLRVTLDGEETCPDCAAVLAGGATGVCGDLPPR